jgi:tetratricopeptide (TPR) repeat protein
LTGIDRATIFCGSSKDAADLILKRLLYWWAGVAQLVERELPKLDVAGSRPVSRSICIYADMMWCYLRLCLGLALNLVACGAPSIPPQSPLDTAEIHFSRGVDLFDSGRVDDALRQFERARSLEPDFPGVQVGSALISMSQGQYWQARQDLKKALHADRNLIEGYITLGRVIAAEGLGRGYDNDAWVEEALKPLKQAQRRAPQHDKVAYYQGVVQMQAGNIAESRQAFTRVIKLNRGPWVARAMEQVERLQLIERAAPGTRLGARIAFTQQISRAELVVLLLEELNLEKLVEQRRVPVAPQFSPPPSQTSSPRAPTDIETSWARPWLETFLRLQIGGLEQYSDGTFRPDQPLLRANYALLNQRILTLISGDKSLERRYIGEDSRFVDVGSDFYAYNAIALNTQRGLMDADTLTGRFRPNDPVSGAEALLILRKMQNLVRQEF